MAETQRIGQQFGLYRLTRLLDSGDFADDYLGEHVHLGVEGEVKILHTRMEGESQAVFARRARTLARLDHQHLVRVRDFGIDGTLPFLVTDYAPYGSLRERYARGTQVPLAVVLSYVGPLADVLQYIHDQGVIHRNLKPAKVLLDKNGRLLLTDTGIMSLVYEEQEPVGTVTYMAPEQLQGRPQAASDQYALGVMVYEWLTGVPPFSGTPMKELVRQHLTTPPPTLRDKNPLLSPDVEAAVLRTLAKDPQERFASMRDFALALFAAGGQGSLPASGLPGFDAARPAGFSPVESPGSQPAYTPYPEPPVGGWSVDEDYSPYAGLKPAGSGQAGTGAYPVAPIASPGRPAPTQQSYAEPPGTYAGQVEQGAYPGQRAQELPGPQPRNLAQEQLRFTAFYPQIVPVETWNTLLVYSYVESAFRAVLANAERFKVQLGADPFKADAWAAQALTRGTEITVMPLVQGITFNPPRNTFIWTQDWHPTLFSFGVDRSWTGRVGSGDILIFAGPVVIAALRISLRFGAQNVQDNRVQAEVSASRYRKIFTSYSHADTPIVQALRHASQALGDESFLDVENLRSGQDWNAALLRAIDKADVFQLFWSRRSAQSQYVAQEYRYALQHYKYEGFIRPVYWEKPMVPPPQELSHLHFAYYPTSKKRFGLFNLFKRE